MRSSQTREKTRVDVVHKPSVPIMMEDTVQSSIIIDDHKAKVVPGPEFVAMGEIHGSANADLAKGSSRGNLAFVRGYYYGGSIHALHSTSSLSIFFLILLLLHTYCISSGYSS